MEGRNVRPSSRDLISPGSRKAVAPPVPAPRSDSKNLARIEAIKQRRKQLMSNGDSGNLDKARKLPSPITVSPDDSKERILEAPPQLRPNTKSTVEKVNTVSKETRKIKATSETSVNDIIENHYAVNDTPESQLPVPLVRSNSIQKQPAENRELRGAPPPTKPTKKDQLALNTKPVAPYKPISEEYLTHLLQTMYDIISIQDKKLSRDDFLTEDGYYSWLDKAETSGEDMRFGVLLMEMLRSWDIKYPLMKPKQSKDPHHKTSIKLLTRIVEARHIETDSKGKQRNCFAVIEYADPVTRELLRYETKPCLNASTPVWNQDITLTISNLIDPIKVSIYHLKEKNTVFGDNTKEELIGEHKINVQTIMTDIGKSSFADKWFKLGQNSDAEVHIEFEMLSVDASDHLNSENTTLEEAQARKIQHLFISHKVNLKSLFNRLVEACVMLDLGIKDKMHLEKVDVKDLDCTLSAESETVLSQFSKLWSIGDMFKKISILRVVFDMYKKQLVHAKTLLMAYRIIYIEVFRQGSVWLPSYEQPILFNLLSDIESYMTEQIRNFKAFFSASERITKSALRHVASSLACIVLLTRMIDKNPFFLENVNDMKPTIADMQNESQVSLVRIGISDLDYKNGKFSFKEKLHGIIQSKMVSNYQHFSEMATPIENAETVPGMVCKCLGMAKMILTEIEQDRKVYRKGFLPEIDILPISIKAYVPNLILEIQNMARFAKRELNTKSTLFSDDAPAPTTKSTSSLASKTSEISFSSVTSDGLPQTEEELIAMAFELLQLLNVMEEKIASYKLSDCNIEFDKVSQFSPFVFRWLDITERRTVEWVENAIKLDNFAIQQGQSSTSSVTDLFAAIFSALEFLEKTIGSWRSNETHYALFMTRFAQCAYKAINSYCQRMDSMSLEKKDHEQATDNSNKANSADSQDVVNNVLKWISNATTGSASTSDKREIPRDCNMETLHENLCVRLCNMEALSRRLRTLYKSMDGVKVADAAEQWRRRKGAGQAVDDDRVSGILRLRILAAENLKAKGFTGKTMPYVVIRRSSFKKTTSRVYNFEVARSRVASGVNPIWTYLNPRASRAAYSNKNLAFLKEPAHYIIPVVDATELIIDVYHKQETGAFTFMSGEDILLGEGKLRLSRTAILNGTNDSLYWVELGSQGKVLIQLELAVDGVSGLDRIPAADGISFGLAGSEDIDYWFMKMESCVDSSRFKIVRKIVDDLHSYVAPELSKIVCESLMRSDSSNVTVEEADFALAPLAKFLNRNLAIFSASLPSTLTQYVIFNIWRRNILYPLLQYLYPTPYHAESIVATSIFSTAATGPNLDKRQKNMLQRCLALLIHFFHAEGDSLGIPLVLLKTCSGFIPGDSKRNREISRDLFILQ